MIYGRSQSVCQGKPSSQVSVSRTPSYSPSLQRDPRSELDLSGDRTVGDAVALKPASSQPSLQKAEQRGGLAFSCLVPHSSAMSKVLSNDHALDARGRE